jgi:phage-related protein
MNDLQESVGKPFSELQVKLINAVRPGIEKLIKFINENSYKVVNFFTNLPEIAMTALSMIPKIFETVFSLDFIKAWFQGIMNYYTTFLPALGKGLIEWYTSGFKAMGSFIKGISAGLWVPIREKFQDIIGGLRIFFADVINFFIDRINDFISGLNRLTNMPLIKEALGALGKKGDLTLIANIDTKALTDKIKLEKSTEKPLDQQIEEERSKAYKEGVDGLIGILGSLGTIFDGLKDTVTPAIDVIGDKLKPLKDKIANLINTVKENTGAVDADTISRKKDTTSTAPSINLKDLGLGNLNDLFESFSSGWGDIVGNLSGGLKTILAPLATGLEPIIASLGSLAGPAAILAVVMTGLVQILGPAIQTVISPLVNTLIFIGQILGALFLPLLDALAPIISIICQLATAVVVPLIEMLIPQFQFLISIITILTPLFKDLAVLVVILASPLKWVGDLFTWFGNVMQVIGHNITEYINHIFDPQNRSIQSIPGFSSDAFTGLAERIAKIMATETGAGLASNLFGDDWNDFVAWVQSGASAATGYTTTSGTAASYSTRDVTINFYNQAPAVGDEGLRKLALLIREQLSEAEALGA